jgi:exonuclease III
MAVTTNICTYNMHGFRQGIDCLRELCKSMDIILVQEHWLAPDDLIKLDIDPDFIAFSSSAMEKTVSHGFLRGRPYGGIALLLRRHLAMRAKLVCSVERCIIMSIDNFLICNVYLPCVNTPFRDEIYAETLTYIADAATGCDWTSIIVGGDFDFNFNTCHSGNIYRLSLSRTDQLLAVDDRFSFSNANGDLCSLIDHFLVSSSFLGGVHEISTCSNGLNLSDHLPLCLKCNLNLTYLDNGNKGESSRNHLPALYLRWDKAKFAVIL